MSRITYLVALLLLPTLAAAAPGPLLLVGGGSRPAPILRRFVELAGGSEASIVVLPTASSLPDAGRSMADEFRGVGATDVRALDLRTRDDAEDPAFVAALRGARGVWLTGGDQSRITAALRGTPAFAALRAAHRGGAVLGGTSAGTACMTPVMLTGSGDRGVIQSGNVPLAPGLGFLPGVVVDQHFVARQRQHRLLSVVLEDPVRLGVGVDEATAIEVNLEAGTFDVRGRGWVYVFDASRARVLRREDQLGVTGLRTHVLLSGQGFDLRRREPR